MFIISMAWYIAIMAPRILSGVVMIFSKSQVLRSILAKLVFLMVVFLNDDLRKIVFFKEIWSKKPSLKLHSKKLVSLKLVRLKLLNLKIK